MNARRMIAGILMLLSSGGIRAQIEEHFSDGNFTQNPVWEGDAAHFKINTAFQLQTQGETADTFFLATPNSSFGNTEWEFWMKLSFNTSANNYCRIYLVSGSRELEGPLEGYLIQVGGQHDSIVFMRQEGFSLIPLFHFPGCQTNQTVNHLRFKVIHTDMGEWDFWLDATGGDQFVYQGKVVDQTLTATQWFGFFCKVTSSNTSKCYFDDIYAGPERKDSIPPLVTSLTLIDSVHLGLRFSESPDLSTALNIENYMVLSSLEHPLHVSFQPSLSDELILDFLHPFLPQSMDTLHISGILDLAGNQIPDTLIPFARYRIQPWDILIHEVMMDPEPVVGLPPAEYVELFNTTPFPLSLDGWEFGYGSSVKTIRDAVIEPGGYLLLVKDSALAVFGTINQIFTSNTSLTNSGSRLTLYDTSHHVIHSIAYDPEWITAVWKSEGGWSLEMIDQDNPCGCASNWAPSCDPLGGTPGRANSVQGSAPDLEPPIVAGGFLRDTVTWELHFSETLDTLMIGLPDQWNLEPGSLKPLEISPVGPSYQAIRLRFSRSFEPGIRYILTSSHCLTDCAGNLMTNPVFNEAAIPRLPEREGLLFSELLFDPYPDGSRFIELYNASSDVLDLRDIGLCAMESDSTIQTSGAQPVVSDPFLLFPGTYVAVCQNIGQVVHYYDTPNRERLVEATSFPKMTNEGGRLVVTRLHDEAMIDMVDYDASMHYPLLVSKEGVSLERIRFDQPTRLRDNWHSAAYLAGYATPGYENSQFRNSAFAEEGTTEVTLEINPPAFSPNNDGMDDVVEINCVCELPGGQLTLMIFDARGHCIRRLASNILAGVTNRFIWNGVDDQGHKAPIGIYVLLVGYVHPSGSSFKGKKPIVITAQ